MTINDRKNDREIGAHQSTDDSEDNLAARYTALLTVAGLASSTTAYSQPTPLPEPEPIPEPNPASVPVADTYALLIAGLVGAVAARKLARKKKNS